MRDLQSRIAFFLKGRSEGEISQPEETAHRQTMIVVVIFNVL